MTTEQPNGEPARRQHHEDMQGLEGLRFISSCAIVLMHFLPYVAPVGRALDGLRIFVDLFFVISGIVIASAYADRLKNRRDYLVFLWRRVARLYPLHLATLAAFVGIGLLGASGLIHVRNPDRYDMSQIPLHLLLVQAWVVHGKMAFNAVTWSISAEMFAYIAFPALLWLTTRAGHRSVLAVLGVTLMCAALSYAIKGYPFTMLGFSVSPLRALPGFALGVWIWVHRGWLARLGARRARALALLCGFVLLPLCLIAGVNDYPALGVVWLLVASVFIADIRGAPSVFGHRALSGGGHLTYSIYMIHSLVTATFLAYLAPKLFGSSVAGQASTLLVAIAATYALSVLSFRYFEDPLRVWLGQQVGSRRSMRLQARLQPKA